MSSKKPPELKSIIVAGSRMHARAMVGWSNLDKTKWRIACYGDALFGEKFANARVIFPTTGIEDWQIDWLVKTLAPLVTLSIKTVPDRWSDEADDNDLSGFFPYQEKIC